MELSTETFLQHMDAGLPVTAGTPAAAKQNALAQQAMKITAELNSAYHTPQEITQLLTRLTGRPVDASVRLFPPFYTDCGRNIKLGKNVFINALCCFQDQGGITIGDGALLGHQVVLATLNHGLAPRQRATTLPAPIVLGKNVWVGAHATILQGVTVGDNAVIAAGAVVTKDVPANTVVGGVPAKVLRTIPEQDAQECR